jgi:predicted transcriptional regulator
MEHLKVEKIKSEFHKDSEIVAYTTAGKSLTREQYIEEINIGLRQIENGELLTDDELQKEVDTW